MASIAGGTSAPSLEGMKDKLGGKIWRTDTSKSGEMTPELVQKLIQDVSDSEVSSVLSEVESITSSVTDRLEFSIFDFVGFDPLMVVRVLKAYQKHYKDADNDLLSDIRFSVAAVLYMGNLQTKSLTRRALEGKAKIEYLTLKYDIRVGSQGAGIPAEALTFPRIAATFPTLAIRMAQHLHPSAVSLEFFGRDVPAFMRLTPFASLCSAQMEPSLRTFLLEACNAHGSDMALAYEKGRCKKSKQEFKLTAKEAAEDQWAFMEVAADSPVPAEGVKKSMIMELNLPAHYVSLEKVVRNYRHKLTGVEAGQVSVLSKATFEQLLSAYVASG